MNIKESIMMRFVQLLLLLWVTEMAFAWSGFPGIEASSPDSLPTQFIVIVRDMKTNQLVPDPRIGVETINENAPSEIYGSASSWWGESIGGITLGKGSYRLRVAADRYVTQIIEGIRIERGEPMSGVWKCGQVQPQGFIGRTIILGILLELRTDRRLTETTRLFVSDTTYYTQPEIAPSPKGGMDGLRKKIDLSQFHVKSQNYEDQRRAPLFAHVYIDASGKVDRVDLDGEVQKGIASAISKAIYSTRFNPASMLGKPVRSQVHIPFDISSAVVERTEGYDVACKNLKIVPSNLRVGDRPWVRFEVANLSENDIPGRSIEVGFYIDGKSVIWSGGYPQPLKAHKSVFHSVAEQYMEPLTSAGPHKYKLIVALKGGTVDVDTTNNVIEGILHVAQ